MSVGVRISRSNSGQCSFAIVEVWQSRTIGFVGFSRAELESFVGATVPDLIGPGLQLLFVGINPGLWTAATQTHFAHPGNRFYPALLEAGIIDEPIDRGVGMTDADRRSLIDRGIGITNIVHRATAKASELTRNELRAGGDQLRVFVRTHRPTVVAVAGITAYRAAFDMPKAAMGEQPELVRRCTAVRRAEPERTQRARDDQHARGGLPRSRPSLPASSAELMSARLCVSPAAAMMGPPC